MDKKKFGLLAFFTGSVLAIVHGLFNLGEWAEQVLYLLAILSGIFHFGSKDLIALGVIYLAISVTTNSLGGLSLIGPEITTVVTVWIWFLGPVVLTAMIFWGTPMLFKGKKSG